MQERFDGVRMSALRFGIWCSTSFVSADGLVMPNHHCAREVAMKDTEHNVWPDIRKTPGLLDGLFAQKRK